MSTDCCTWSGVTCSQKTRDVIGLDLSNDRFVGTILSNNTLFQLSYLESIIFDYTDLHGVLPEEIFHLPNLRRLSLSNNPNLTVSLPRVKWGSSSSLQMLFLGQTTLSGGLPDSIGCLKSLIFLSITGCSVTSTIPSSIGNLTQLTQLDLSLNKLTGEIPISLANLQNLTILSLHGNNMIGQFPSCLAKLGQLELLDLTENSLKGPLPVLPCIRTVVCFPKLTTLHLKKNSLDGTVPSWLFELSSLTELSIDDNGFTGQLNEFNSSSSLLQIFSCKNNLLNGTIPKSFSELVNPTSLNFFSNHFSGVLDLEMFSHYENLYSLDLSHNSLSVQITSSATLNPNLIWLGLSSCKIITFPHFLRHLETLQYLDLSDNLINGDIPEWIGSTGRYSLYYLNLSHNSLTGGLEHLNWSSLQYLDLQSNMLKGSLPASIYNMSSLDVLNLSHNKLSGILHTCEINLNHSLSVLDLRMNSIRGSLPSALSNFRKLRTLNLHRNKLGGIIPHSFAELESLEILDLGNNRINDTFPWWLEALQNLQVLVLKSNKFHGIINTVSSIKYPFPSLRIIDLSENKFSGPLPSKYIKNFKAMMNGEVNKMERSYMGNSFYSDRIIIVIKGVEFELVRILTVFTTIDLSKNTFGGNIPQLIGNLKSLRYLNLSHNHLSGNIPSLIGNLSMLESIDLSSNQLVGEIPQQLTHIYSLSRLNVSQNQLSGRILEGAQFNTFENNSYAGNSGLCGRPLSKKCGRDIIEPQEEDEDNDYNLFSGFTWEAVVIGYCGGVVVGFVAGYIMFMVGKPKWYIGIIARELGLKVRRVEISRRSR